MMDTKSLIFDPNLSEFLQSRDNSYYTTLSGGNNSGKSVILKNMKMRLGRRAYMAGPQRFYHVFELSTQRWNLQDYDSWDHQFRHQFSHEETNTEHNFIDLGRVLGSLKDKKREQLFSICSTLIGGKFSLKRRDSDNELSPRYVDMDGQNLAVGSTGTRLLMTLLGLCMDEQFDVMLIDEPELGLSPRVQSALALFLADKKQRDIYFPHLKSIFVSTHSHAFLDRNNIENNFIISKSNKKVSIRQVDSVGALHDLQFNMLGNSLENLFLPSAFIICEGKTDKPFIERLVQLRHPGRKILVIEGQGDVKRVFRSLTQSLGDIYKSPFRSRTFLILDSIHTKGTKQDLVDMGALENNVVVWDKNGIEYVYPPRALSSVFGCAEEDLYKISILSDEVSHNGITKRKSDLCREILSYMTPQDTQAAELEEKLLKPLSESIGA